MKALLYVRAAFLAPANLIALTAASVGSIAGHDPVPATIALGLEALYLGTLSWLPQFRRAVRARPTVLFPQPAPRLSSPRCPAG